MSKKMTSGLLKGGEIAAKFLKQEAFIQEQAMQAELVFFVADCAKARNRSAILRALAKAVDYPVFFGADIEALSDCLKEVVSDQKRGLVLWVKELHSGDPSLTEDVAAIQEVFAEIVDYAQTKQKIFAYMIEHAGKHTAPDLGVAPTRYAE